MTDVGQANFASIARKQLSLTSDAPVPKFYINELKHHLRYCPKEDNFHVSLQPRAGYGSVICLKEGCNKTIPLIKRNGTRDGGKRDGFGSLSAYRTHLAEHKALSRPMHAPPNKAFPKEVVKPPSEAAASAVAPASLSSTPSSATSQVASGAAQLKVEKSGISTRKRPSDSAFTSELRDSSASTKSQASKRLKTDVAAKGPLSSVTNTTTPATASRASNETMYAGYDLSQDPLFMLENVRAAVAGQQILIQSLRMKPFRSMEDLRNIQSAEAELDRLTVMEQGYQTTLFGMPSSSSLDPFSESWALSPPDVSLPDDFDQGASSTFRQDDMDVDFMPYSEPEDPILFSHPVGPSLVHSSPAFVSTPMSTNYNTAGNAYNTVVPHLPAFVDQNANRVFNAAQAPGSSQQLPPAPQPMATSVTQVSSSKVLPEFLPEGIDAEYESTDSSDEENMPDATDFLNRIGVKAPLPVLDDSRDHNGDYYGRGRDLFDGPRAAPDDLERFLIQAGNAEVFDGNQRVDDALRYLGLKGLNDVIPGMEVPLMAHQAMGVKWMLEKERSGYMGGCLADEMGLGKTVQMIATMLKNKPKTACKTTLIVAPLSLLDQWKTEIETKTNCGLTCLVYHGNSKIITTKKKFLQHDIVLTTFNTLAREWPDFETEMKKKKKAKKNGDAFIVSDDDEDMKDSWYRSQKRKERAGLLFQVELFRVVLDEAQYIRNRRTRVSRALTDIQATYRWCLTGTPIVNTLSDAYSYLRFLKIRPWYDWDQFNSRIARNERKRPEVAITRLHAVMSTFLLRRQKNTKLDGEPIIKLPEKEIKLVKLEFSKEERDVYNMIEARNQAIFNRYLRAGTVLKNYHHVLVLLLRLRQICSHASLVAEDANAYVRRHEADENFKIEFSDELTRARRVVSEEFVTKMKARFKREALDRIEAEKSSASIEEEDCPICYDAMTDAVLTACGHIFCRECIGHLVNFMDTHAGEDRGCPCCREPLDVKKLFSRSAFEPTDKELNPSSGSDSAIEIFSDDDYVPSHGKGKGRASGRSENRRMQMVLSETEDDLSDFIVESGEDEDEKDVRRALKKNLGKKRVHVILDSDDEVETPEEKEVLLGVRAKGVSNEAIEELKFLPSSKMKHMMNELERLFKSRPDEKTIVVSQWTRCLDLVSSYLTEKGIPHVKYQGDMDRPKRDQAVRVFMSREKARVMLMSLKCGGVGLNLTRANNVISLDLGWSFAVESQAFDRVHRVGQLRNVLVQRVVIADTVEDRILRMQERKKTFAEGALGEGSAKKMGRLSVQELANLFGLDARGRVIKD